MLHHKLFNDDEVYWGTNWTSIISIKMNSQHEEDLEIP